MTKQHRMLGLNITLISFNFFVWLFGYFECAAPDVFALLHTKIIIQIKLLCTEDHDKSVSTSEHFQANHDEQTQKLCWGWTVRWKITIQGRKWKSKVCDYSTIVGSDSASDTLWCWHLRISVAWFSTFLSQAVLLPISTFAFAMSLFQTRWSHCTKLSMECRMVSQILTSRLFEGHFPMKCHGDR